MSMREGLVLFLCLFCLAGCSDQNVSPSEDFLIPREEMPSVIEAAERGDIAAIRRVIAHYDVSPNSSDVADKWRARARRAGDARELYDYAASLATGAKSESELSKRRLMLSEARESARLSYERDPDPYAKRLLDEIDRSLREEK